MSNKDSIFYHESYPITYARRVRELASYLELSADSVAYKYDEFERIAKELLLICNLCKKMNNKR